MFTALNVLKVSDGFVIILCLSELKCFVWAWMFLSLNVLWNWLFYNPVWILCEPENWLRGRKFCRWPEEFEGVQRQVFTFEYNFYYSNFQSTFCVNLLSFKMRGWIILRFLMKIYLRAFQHPLKMIHMIVRLLLIEQWTQNTECGKSQMCNQNW